MAPRISPEKDALHHVINKCDKTKLDIKFIDAVKGRGLFAIGSFAKGEFVAEYRGDFIDCKELERRKRVYHLSCAVFLFEFKWRGKTWCIDASVEDGTFGRIVNDDHIHPNCKMKRIDVEGKPHLCLFTLRDIKEGEEITYDYGGDDCPWREKMTHVTVDGTTTGFLHHSNQPHSHMNMSFGNDAFQKQMTHVTADGTTTGFLEQSDQPQSHMNTSFGNDTSQKKMTHVTADGTTTGFLEQSDQPQSHMNTSFGNDTSQKKANHLGTILALGQDQDFSATSAQENL